MALDDLRARMHTLNKALADAANLADGLAVDLQNYQPQPAPDPDPPAPPVKIRFGQHKYANNTPVNVEAADVFDVQRGFTLTGTPRPGMELYVYATIVRRPTDPEGRTQFLPPRQVADSWCAHTPTGGLVTRTRGEGPEQLINFAVAQWRAQAIPNIVNEVVNCKATGLYVDEVDAWWKYAWEQIATTGAKEFTSESWWRSMWLSFLRELAAALRAKGKKLWVNLGANYNLSDAWQSAIVDAVDAVNIEFYTGRQGVNAGPTTATDGWLSQNNFLAAVEARGKAVHVHSSSLDQKVTDYAFCSWLLHTEFLGSFSASLDYGGTVSIPSSGLLAKAQALGRPLGKRVPHEQGGGYTRLFEGGRVSVNPVGQANRWLPATSGLIELR